jgi:hypothetical protein
MLNARCKKSKIKSPDRLTLTCHLNQLVPTRLLPDRLFPGVVNCLVWVDREENLEYARDILLTKLIEVVELEPIRQKQEAIHPHFFEVLFYLCSFF